MAGVGGIAIADAVAGELPRVCVATGAVSDSFLEVDVYTWPLRRWWFLLLFGGPLGLVTLVALLWASPQISVRLPMTESSVDRHLSVRQRKRLSCCALAILALANALAIGSVEAPTPVIAVLVAALLLSAVATGRYLLLTVGTDIEVVIDRSTGTLKLDFVSAEFVRAYEAGVVNPEREVSGCGASS